MAELTPPHRRRPRYRGTHPRRFEEKYKEQNPQLYPETVAKVLASGKTPAGTHRPIMVAEVIGILQPQPGCVAVDATLGHGGHALEISKLLQPGGHLYGMDVDPIELPKTEARLGDAGFGSDICTVHRSNFAGLPQLLARVGVAGADLILADLGVSSMQLDDPGRGFSFKVEGPLDMRMNPTRGLTASKVLEKSNAESLAELLVANSDEPHARVLGQALAGRAFRNTKELVGAIHSALPRLNFHERELTVRLVFQALRIAVNDEFSALEMFLRNLPSCLNPNGRVAILTFHSGEDRRVKKAFQAGRRDGIYAEIADEPIVAGPEERRANPRSSSAKLRWARRGEA